MVERELIDVTGVNRDGTAYSGQMYQTLVAPTKKTSGGVIWGVCSICLMTFPVNEMMKYKGKYYCRKNKCFEDTLPKEH